MHGVQTDLRERHLVVLGAVLLHLQPQAFDMHETYTHGIVTVNAKREWNLLYSKCMWCLFLGLEHDRWVTLRQMCRNLKSASQPTVTDSPKMAVCYLLPRLSFAPCSYKTDRVLYIILCLAWIQYVNNQQLKATNDLCCSSMRGVNVITAVFTNNYEAAWGLQMSYCI